MAVIHRIPNTMSALVVALIGLGVAATATAAPPTASVGDTEVRSGLAPAALERVGFGSRSIIPPPEMIGEVYHVSSRRVTGVLPGDGLDARAVYLDAGERALAIVALDLLGLFYDDVLKIRERVQAELGAQVEVIVASTHTHATVDTLGIYHPDGPTVSALHPPYQEFVHARAAEAILDAAEQAAGVAAPVTMRVAARLAPEGLNEYDINRHPGSFDDTVHAMRFSDAHGDVIGTIVNWASHPELLDPRVTNEQDPGIPADIQGAVLSGDYVHTLREAIEADGGDVVFLNGPIGAVTGLAMHPTDPATGEPFPRRSVAKASYVGERIAETALAALDEDGTEIEGPMLSTASAVFHLRVDNPFLLALVATGTVDRATYLAGVEVPMGREVRTEMIRVDLGPVQFLTVPGELHPDVYTGGYLPREERANPDVPRERPIRPQMGGAINFLVGLGMDELGYFVSATDFVPPSTVFPIYDRGVDRHGRRHYQETLSLGRDTARSIGQIASLLLGHEPEADYQPFIGGFLDEAGRPMYRLERADQMARVRGIWLDTSGSGRYEQTRDAQIMTPLPSGVPAAFGFLDAFFNDLGIEPTSRARGVWVDGDGDGVFDPARDPHLYFDTYHVGKGPLSPLP